MTNLNFQMKHTSNLIIISCNCNFNSDIAQKLHLNLSNKIISSIVNKQKVLSYIILIGSTRRQLRLLIKL